MSPATPTAPAVPAVMAVPAAPVGRRGGAPHHRGPSATSAPSSSWGSWPWCWSTPWWIRPWAWQTVRAVIPIMLFILLAMGLNIVVGYSGLLDLGYAAFFAVGAYTAAFLTLPFLPHQAGRRPPPALPAGLLGGRCSWRC